MENNKDFFTLVSGKNKKVYISGAISEIEDKNIDEFIKISNFIASHECIPVNPHILGTRITKNNPAWEDYMKVDIAFLTKCDLVLLIDNWESSNGVAVEMFIAQMLKIPVFHFPSLEKFSYHYSIQKIKNK